MFHKESLCFWFYDDVRWLQSSSIYRLRDAHLSDNICDDIKLFDSHRRLPNNILYTRHTQIGLPTCSIRMGHGRYVSNRFLNTGCWHNVKNNRIHFHGCKAKVVFENILNKFCCFWPPIRVLFIYFILMRYVNFWITADIISKIKSAMSLYVQLS